MKSIDLVQSKFTRAQIILAPTFLGAFIGRDYLNGMLRVTSVLTAVMVYLIVSVIFYMAKSMIAPDK
jgi:hypothetical protein